VSRLDLVEASLLAMNKKCVRRGDKITAQCPAHDDRSPSFTATLSHDGGVLFHCYSGCSGVDVMDALGLRWDQIKPDDYRAERKRVKPRDPTFDECFQMVAENDMRKGKRLTPREQEQYRQCLVRLYNQKGAA
jgi:hypothetical protein